MTMIEEDTCKFCIENGHEVILTPYPGGTGKFCPCCDRLDQSQYHDIKEESEIELPTDGAAPSEFS